MAELVGVFAASHSPLLIRSWDLLPDEVRADISTAYGELGERINSLKADILIEIGPDHLTNFFFDNLPSVLVGIGSQFSGPPEPYLAGLLPDTFAGHPEFAEHLVRHAMTIGAEPSLSRNMNLDHGFCVPLYRAGISPIPAMVPIVINGVQDPMPTFARAFEWGDFIRSAVESYPGDDRVIVLASGGLSHSVGEPSMGAIDEEFDRECLELFEAGSIPDLIAYLTEERVARAGNGTNEMRFWAVAHAAAGGKGFSLIDYTASPVLLIGCAVAAWDLQA